MNEIEAEVRKAYHQELESIREQMVRLAGTVIEAIPRCTQVLLDGDLEGADYMIAADDEVDARSLELEEECVRVVALQAPVATELRELVAALRMIPELERTADLCVNICKATQRLHGQTLDPRLRGLIARMGELAQAQFQAAVESYAEHDTAKAAALVEMDDLLDNVHREFIAAIFEGHADASMELQVAVQMAMVGRFFERIGDHAVNIADKVRYITTGWMPEHDGARRYRASHPDAPPADTAG
jgi:phosphate transport system protein